MIKESPLKSRSFNSSNGLGLSEVPNSGDMVYGVDDEKLQELMPIGERNN